MRTVHNSQAEQIFQHAARLATPFQSRDGQPCVSVPLGIDTHVVWPIDSPQFRDWLADGFYREHDRFPSRNQLRETIQLLTAQARHSNFPEQVVDLRISYRGDRLAPRTVLLDLANPEGQAVEIAASGWTIKRGRHFFRRVNNMEALPAPDPAGAASWPLSRDPKFFAWLMAALRPAGPYPILVLKGPSGAGKSTAARMLRALIDPAASLFCALPATEGDLRALAWDNRVLAFDHMTAFPARIAAGLRRLCSGDLERPILLTVSGDAFPGHCADLWNHAMVAELPAIDPKHRLSQSRLWREFEEARPGLLAALCDGVSEAMRNADQISLESPSAFADAAAWAVAAAPALGFTEAAMRAAVSPHPAAASAPVSSAGFLR